MCSIMPKPESLLSMFHHGAGLNLKNLLLDRPALLMFAAGMDSGLMIPMFPWVDIVWTSKLALELACTVVLVAFVVVFRPGNVESLDYQEGDKIGAVRWNLDQICVDAQGLCWPHSVWNIAKTGDIDQEGIFSWRRKDCRA